MQHCANETLEPVEQSGMGACWWRRCGRACCCVRGAGSGVARAHLRLPGLEGLRCVHIAQINIPLLGIKQALVPSGVGQQGTRVGQIGEEPEVAEGFVLAAGGVAKLACIANSIPTVCADAGRLVSTPGDEHLRGTHLHAQLIRET